MPISYSFSNNSIIKLGSASDINNAAIGIYGTKGVEIKTISGSTINGGNNTVGIYFLDVDLKCSMNGIRLGEKIRELDTRGFIIFTTTHLDVVSLVL